MYCFYLCFLRNSLFLFFLSGAPETGVAAAMRGKRENALDARRPRPARMKDVLMTIAVEGRV
jgi:hypothetical protein